jgi:hypothetical protein
MSSRRWFEWIENNDRLRRQQRSAEEAAKRAAKGQPAAPRNAAPAVPLAESRRRAAAREAAARAARAERFRAELRVLDRAVALGLRGPLAVEAAQRLASDSELERFADEHVPARALRKLASGIYVRPKPTPEPALRRARGNGDESDPPPRAA